MIFHTVYKFSRALEEYEPLGAFNDRIAAERLCVQASEEKNKAHVVRHSREEIMEHVQACGTDITGPNFADMSPPPAQTETA